MNLWIKSQNRELLLQVNMVYIDEHNMICDGKTNVLGEYETKERALEVLDEIDKLMSDAVNNGLKVARYKMPKE